MHKGTNACKGVLALLVCVMLGVAAWALTGMCSVSASADEGKRLTTDDVGGTFETDGYTLAVAGTGDDFDYTLKLSLYYTAGHGGYEFTVKAGSDNAVIWGGDAVSTDENVAVIESGFNVVGGQLRVVPRGVGTAVCTYTIKDTHPGEEGDASYDFYNGYTVRLQVEVADTADYFTFEPDAVNPMDSAKVACVQYNAGATVDWNNLESRRADIGEFIYKIKINGKGYAALLDENNYVLNVHIHASNNILIRLFHKDTRLAIPYKDGDVLVLEKGLRLVECPDQTIASARYVGSVGCKYKMLARDQKFVYNGDTQLWSIDAYAVTGVSLDKEEAVIDIDGTATLTATVTGGAEIREQGLDGVQWASSDPSVATVDQSGRVTGHKVGEAVITAQSLHSDAQSACVVLVAGANDVTGVTVEIGSVALTVGETTTATYVLRGGTSVGEAATVKWSSTNPSVATVDETTGVVTAVGNGTTTIRATATSGDTVAVGSVNVTVTEKSSQDGETGDTATPPAKKAKCGGTLTGSSAIASLLFFGIAGLLALRAKNRRCER